jgi:hypothetical protein
VSRHAMTWAQWCAHAEATPATPAQVHLVHRHFRRLGFGGWHAHRAERLELTARILGLPRLDSTTDLTAGQAGRLLGVLRGIGTRRELYAEIRRAAGDGQGQAGEPAGWLQQLAGIVAVLTGLPPGGHCPDAPCLRKHAEQRAGRQLASASNLSCAPNLRARGLTGKKITELGCCQGFFL